MLQGYALAYALGLGVEILKYIVGRARPIEGFGAFHFEPFAFGRSMNSFPSGDASAALILVGMLSLYFPRSRLIFLVLESGVRWGASRSTGITFPTCWWGAHAGWGPCCLHSGCWGHRLF